MLIAEEILVILHDERGRATIDRYRLNHALAAALLAELALEGYVRLSDPSTTVDRHSRIVAVPETPENPPADPLLAEAAELLRAQEEHKPKDALGKLRTFPGGLRNRLRQRLADAGVLRRGRHSALGIAPVTRWAMVDPVADLRVRTRLRDALITGRTTDERDRALVGALTAIGRAHKNAQCADGFEHRQAKHRAKQITADNWAGQAAKRALRDEQTTAAMSLGGLAFTIATTLT